MTEPTPELPGQLRLVPDLCDAPACVEYACATVRIGPVPLGSCWTQPLDVDRCARLRACPDHVTPFVDRTHARIGDDELVPVTLRWDA